MPLSRDEVLAGAMRLLHEVGLDALTMRRLADSLGVQAGAIYYHFKDKQDLHDAMIESLLSRLLDPPLEGSWEEQLTELSRRTVAALLSHRDGARLATMGLHPGPHGLAASEAFLHIAKQAGMPAKATLWATAVIGYFLLGYATDVQATESAKSRGLVDVASSFRDQLDPVKHRELVALTRNKKDLEEMMSTREFQARFEFGMQVLLTGLKAMIPPSKKKKKPTKRK